MTTRPTRLPSLRRHPQKDPGREYGGEIRARAIRLDRGLAALRSSLPDQPAPTRSCLRTARDHCSGRHPS